MAAPRNREAYRSELSVGLLDLFATEGSCGKSVESRFILAQSRPVIGRVEAKKYLRHRSEDDDVG